MDKLLIKIWDVQHGSAAYVRTPNGKHIVIDLGTGDISGDTSSRYENFSPLRYLYQTYGVRQLDEVIITHPHTDHIDDILNFDLLSPQVLTAPRHIPESDVRKGNRPGDAPKIDAFLQILKRFSGAVPVNTNPNISNNNGGLEIEFFHPVTCGTYNLNNQSIVVFFTYAGSTICIPGDNENASWTELMKDQSFINALKKTDIFVASHHGRKSGFCDDIFEHCKPRLVIISDGPKGETCVADKYRGEASGWNVRTRSNREYKKRYVLTTRSDGSVQIEFSEDANKRYIDVEVE